MNVQEAKTQWREDQAKHAARGIILPDVQMYTPTSWKRDISLAMDAQSLLVTQPSAAIPAILTTTIDPDVIRVAYAPQAFGEILGERKSGDWLDETRMFPIVETVGEVSSYGDFNNNGHAAVNINWPNFQSYLFQTTLKYGEREMERAGLAKINYVSELNIAAATLLGMFQNLSYAFGIGGLQNYGLLNNPFLSASLTPTVKAAGGSTWFTAGGAPNATPNEVFNDVVALVSKVIAQSNGTVDMKASMVLAMSPGMSVAMTFTNSFGVNVEDLLKKNYPNMKILTAPQYATSGPLNNYQGASAAGNVIQLIVDTINGQKVAYAAFNEKMRVHKLVAEMSAWQQKMSAGTWGTILRMPIGVASMVGV